LDAPLLVGVVPASDTPFVLPQSAQQSSKQARVA